MSYQWDVFLSYSHKDINAVSVIMNDLQSAGFRVWQDQTTIIPGRRIREAIHEGIQNSACILILLSRYSLKSKWVLNELDAAMLREIREGKNLVVPILLGRVDEVSIPADIQGKNFIDLRHNFLKNYQRRRDLIVDVVRLAVRTTRSPMAEEWFMGNEGVAMLLTCDYTDRPVSRADRLIEIMIDDLFRDGESYWSEALLLGREFIVRYGREATKKLILFTLNHSKIDLFGGFTEEEFVTALDEVQFLSWSFMVRELSIKEYGMELKFGINDEGTISYRFVNSKRAGIVIERSSPSDK